MAFRRPENYKRYEDIYFYPTEKIETRVANNTHQYSDTFTFTLNKEYDGLDWYRSRIQMSFKLTKLTGANINVNDNNGIVNGAHSFIKNISFSINGGQVYNCTNANHCMNIKNLMSYSPNYAETVATNELFFLDTSTSANSNKYLTRQVQHGRNNDNTGWTPRVFIENEDPSFTQGPLLEKNYLELQLFFFGEIPLNRYSIFEACKDRLLPDSKFELQIKTESDDNIIGRTGDSVCRIIITNFIMLIPQIIPIVPPPPPTAKELVFLNDYTTKSYTTRQKEGEFRITNSITKPRHVYVFFLENSKLNSQTANPFQYNTFTLDGNKTLKRCYLKVNNVIYPTIHYNLPRDEIRLYQKVVGFNGVSLLNKNNFKDLSPFIYFDLSALKEPEAKLSFYYELNNETTVDYTIYAIVLRT